VKTRLQQLFSKRKGNSTNSFWLSIKSGSYDTHIGILFSLYDALVMLVGFIALSRVNVMAAVDPSALLEYRNL